MSVGGGAPPPTSCRTRSRIAKRTGPDHRGPFALGVSAPNRGDAVRDGLLLHEDEVARLRPEGLRVLDLQVAAELVAVTLGDFGVVEALPRNEDVLAGRVWDGDLEGVALVELREEGGVERPCRLDRATDPRDEQVRAPLAHDHPLLEELLLLADDHVGAVVLRGQLDDLGAEAVDRALEGADRRQLALDRRAQLGDHLLVLVDLGEKLGVLTAQTLLAPLALGELRGRRPRPLDERTDAGEHRLAVLDLLLDPALQRGPLPLTRGQPLHAGDLAVHLTDELVRLEHD